MRGAEALYCAPRLGVGIIPACAGSRYLIYCNSDTDRDHPRVCGEQDAFAKAHRGGGGSSPRVRGADATEYGGVIDQGIIPACAGSSVRLKISSSTSRDHPRVCGEQAIVSRSPRARAGSSPRVRGADQRGKHIASLAGIIPACAGSSRPSSSLKACCRDHPRVCGEQLFPFSPAKWGPGSSPRVRGADLKIPAQNTLSL